MSAATRNSGLGAERRRQIVTFVEAFIAEHGHSPTVREVASGVGLAAPSAAHRHLERLVQDGELKKIAVTTNKVAYALP